MCGSHYMKLVMDKSPITEINDHRSLTSNNHDSYSIG